MGKPWKKDKQPNRAPQPTIASKPPAVPAASVVPPAPAAAGPGAVAPSLQTPEERILQEASPAQREEAAQKAAGLPLPVDLEAARRRLREAEVLLKLRELDLGSRQDAAESRQSKQDARQDALDEREAQLQAERERLEKQQREIVAMRRDVEDARQRAVDHAATQQKEEARLLAVKEELQARLAAAEAGFLAERRRSTARLDEELQRLRTELERVQAAREEAAAAAHQQALAAREQAAQQREEARRAWDEELRARQQRSEAERAAERAAQEAALREERAAHEEALRAARSAQEAALREERAALAAAQDELARAQAALRREQQTLRNEQEILKEDEEDLEARAQERAAAELEQAERRRRELEARLAAARADAEARDAALRAREEADRRFGQRTPEEVLQELTALQKEVQALRQQLAERPDAQATERLRTLESEREAREAERLRLQQELEAHKAELSRYRIGAAETERLRDERNLLEARCRLLQGQAEELRSDIERRVGAAGSRVCFEKLVAQDQNPEQQERKALDDGAVTLSELVKELRQRIARDQRLYYRDSDLCCFVAGLAASRLLLLQGISGTGKTSLPRAVAKALLLGHDKVEVQAGWRDRDDLLGHFNAFEHRFREQPFLQALYRAQTPAFRDRPFFLVLDEMNLSHPEQYFADLLSALEEPDPEERWLRLNVPASENRPALLREDSALWVPDNLWFIGTANHDETTKDFADKTYDRAHVMELHRHPDGAPAQESPPRQQPLSLKALQRAFERARKARVGEAQRVQRYIKDHLARLLDERFRIGFGNRLERQIGDFVPVFVEAGGSLAEAADHLLATKLLRRLRDRFDLVASDLKELHKTLDDTCKKELGGELTKTRALLKKELERHATREPS